MSEKGGSKDNQMGIIWGKRCKEVLNEMKGKGGDYDKVRETRTKCHL